MGAGEALRRVLECLASGILMAGERGERFIVVRLVGSQQLGTFCGLDQRCLVL